MPSAGRTWLRALAVWCLLMSAETVHGILRGLVLVPRIGDLPSRHVGTVVGSVLIFAIACLTIRWIGAASTPQLLRIGALWVLLTLAFEIGLGRLLGISWQRIASDYRIDQGGWMPFGMLVVLASPWLAHRLRFRVPSQGNIAGVIR